MTLFMAYGRNRERNRQIDTQMKRLTRSWDFAYFGKLRVNKTISYFLTYLK